MRIVYLVWGSWAQDPAELYSIWTNRQSAEHSMKLLIEQDEYNNDYWITEREFFS